MEYVYLICAVFGGTLLVLQFVLAVFGLGAEAADFDVDVDVSDDVDFDADVGLAAHGSTWIFAVISFKTIVASLAFFGLAGMAANAAGWTNMASIGMAIISGFLALLVVHWLVQGFRKLNHDGSLRIERALGKRGTVYLSIPPSNEGEGKIQLRMQNRIVELQAVTNQTEKLKTGSKIVVIDILTPTTVEVERIHESNTVGDPHQHNKSNA